MPPSTRSSSYPIPSLGATLSEIDRVMRYALSEPEYLEFVDSLDDFRRNAGPEIQRRFEQLARASAARGSWATELFVRSLLQLRAAIPLSTNFVLMLEQDVRTPPQLFRAAGLLAAVAALKQQPQRIAEFAAHYRIRENSQVSQSLRVTRVPGGQTDMLIDTPDSTHVLVLRRGIAFQVEIMASGRSLQFGEILHSLKRIVDFCENPKQQHTERGVLGLSALPRPQWAEVRNNIKRKSEESSSAIDCIERAILVLSLEDEIQPVDFADAIKTVRMGRTPGNRYYDKPINIVVFSDGNAGILFEHTAIDGVAAFHICQALFQLAMQTPASGAAEDLGDDPPLATVRPLLFAVDENDAGLLPVAIQDDSVSLSSSFVLQDDLLDALEGTGLLQPWVIVSLQLALRLQRKTQTFKTRTSKPIIVMPCYVGHFRNGRSDSIYIATSEAEDLLNAVEAETAPQSELRQKFEAAVGAIQRRLAATQRGRAFSPHIAALGLLADAIPPAPSVVEYLRLFRMPEVILTGVPFRCHIPAGLGNVYAPEQLVVSFVRNNGAVAFSLGARGRFAGDLRQLSKALDSSLHTVGALALRSAKTRLDSPRERPPSTPFLEAGSEALREEHL